MMYCNDSPIARLTPHQSYHLVGWWDSSEKIQDLHHLVIEDDGTGRAVEPGTGIDLRPSDAACRPPSSCPVGTGALLAPTSFAQGGQWLRLLRWQLDPLPLRICHLTMGGEQRRAVLRMMFEDCAPMHCKRNCASPVNEWQGFLNIDSSCVEPEQRIHLARFQESLKDRVGLKKHD